MHAEALISRSGEAHGLPRDAVPVLTIQRKHPYRSLPTNFVLVETLEVRRGTQVCEFRRMRLPELSSGCFVRQLVQQQSQVGIDREATADLTCGPAHEVLAHSNRLGTIAEPCARAVALSIVGPDPLNDEGTAHIWQQQLHREVGGGRQD
jgi:hypothetical protein